MNDAVKKAKDQANQQYEKTKEKIKNYKPDQLKKEIKRCEEDIVKYDRELIDLQHKIKEFEYKRSLAEQEKELAETKLKQHE